MLVNTSRRLAVTLSLALTIGACSSSKPAATGPTTSAPSTTSVTAATTTTTAPTTADPLRNVVMLGVNARTIDALDAQGRKVKTLVTVFAGRRVENAQLMADRETIWYPTTQGSPRTCDEIVKLNLRTNVRVVEADAVDFTLSTDGSRLLLVWPKPASATAACTEKAALTITGSDAISVRDLRTGAQSAVAVSAYPTAGAGGPYGHVWMSPSGIQLVDSPCTNDPCVMRSITVPTPLGAPLVVHAFGTGPQCGCGTIVTGSDGIYGIDIGSLNHSRTRLRRYDPTQLVGTGTVLVSPVGVRLGSVAPTAAGVYLAGYDTGSKTAYLYRLVAGGLQHVTAISYSAIFAVPAA